MNPAIQEHVPDCSRTLLEGLAQVATLAPSSHNSQPWHFIVGEDSIALSADRTRALPVIDPFDRELLISCGAALFNLRVALSHAKLPCTIRILPSDVDPDLLAHIKIDPQGYSSPHLAGLYEAIRQRVTTRASFDAAPIPSEMQHAFVEAGTAEGAQIVCVESFHQRSLLADLITEADHVQFSSPRFRRELASWIDPHRRGDGMPVYAAGIPALLDHATPIAASVVRTFDLGNGLAAMHQQLVEASPLLICIGTTRDDVAAWLEAGQALQHILLVAARAGYTASYLNQPIEIAHLREQLATTLGLTSQPQQLIRVGIGPETQHSLRRPFNEVIS